MNFTPYQIIKFFENHTKGKPTNEISKTQLKKIRHEAFDIVKEIEDQNKKTNCKKTIKLNKKLTQDIFYIIHSMIPQEDKNKTIDEAINNL